MFQLTYLTLTVHISTAGNNKGRSSLNELIAMKWSKVITASLRKSFVNILLC